MLGLATLSTGIYLTFGLGPALIIAGGLLLLASLIAGRSGE